MKWTIHELIKQVTMENSFSDTIDYNDKLDDFNDIYSISPVEVEGEYEIYDNEEFVFFLKIKCQLILACAITLKEVPYDIDIEVEEVFSTYKDDNNHIIEGITIDLLPIIWSNIILEKPMRILSENAYENFDVENTKLDDDEEVNSAFAALKEYKK